MIAKTRLYLTADRSVVVSEGDKRAAFLLVPAGVEIPAKIIEKYRLGPAKPAQEILAVIPEEKIASRVTRVPKALRTRSET